MHRTFKITMQMLAKQMKDPDPELGQLPFYIRYNLRASLYVIPGVMKIYVGEQVPQLSISKPQIVYIGTRFTFLTFTRRAWRFRFP